MLAASGALWLASLGWLVGTWALAFLQPFRRRTASSPAVLPPVSIIVPTSAFESARSKADRRATIASLLELETGEAEIVVCVDRGKELADQISGDRVRVIGAAEPSSANAKVDAMASGVQAARHDLLLFSDDDVRLDRQHLARLAAQAGHDIGLVSAAAIGTAPENLWGELELAFMNNQFARLHLAGDFLGMGGVLGKSILVRRADLARVGGVFRRWLSCRRKYIPATFACEALFCAPVACLAGAVAFGAMAFPPAAGAAVTAATWCAIDCLFILANRWHFGPLTPLAWLVRELIFLPLWTAALFARTVRWHGRLVPVVD